MKGIFVRRYCFEHLPNIRDLGGIPLPCGKFTRPLQFIRSDAPVLLTKNEQSEIQLMGIRTIVDLRSEHEVESHPNVLAGEKDIHYHLCPQKGGWEMPSREEDIPATYMRIASGFDRVLPVLQIFAEAPNAVLFHCAAGKDRTGVFAALLLLIAGALPCDIVADYEVSYIYRKAVIDEKHRANPGIPYFWSLSRPEYMIEFLHLFTLRYGDIANYCKEIGLSHTAFSAIQNKLTGSPIHFCSC